MINLLFNLLYPLLSGMGVSQADLMSYLTKLAVFIYIILGLTIALIVFLIAVHFFRKKGGRATFRGSAVLAYLAILVVLANTICYGPMYANVSGALNASPIELSDDVVANSQDIIKQTGEEGLVLLKNENLLPLSPTNKLNVFGWDSTNPLFGGTGSGSSDSNSAIGIIQSLNDAGFETNETLTQMYKDYCSERPNISMSEQDWTLPEPTADYYTDELLNEAKDFSDIAVIVLGRSGGEGADLPTDMNAVINGTYDLTTTGIIESSVASNYNYTRASYTNNGDYDDFDEGETYLELSNTEEAMIDIVCNNFDKVIVVINSNNPMELGWVDSYENIGAVILAPGTGATGMVALGEIINGSVNPSGRTVDTYVYDLKTTPYFNNIGNFSYEGVDDLKQSIAAVDVAYEGNVSFVNYVEGIYVGYKFYETAAEEGLIDFDATVQYPFGYGLSYTTFTQTIDSLEVNNDGAILSVTVTNTGDVAGKDVVELYYNPPYTNGGIEKASVNLLDYHKTSLLEPGASEQYTFEFSLEDLASYDSQCIKTANGGYVLEAGDYTFSLRSDSHTVLAAETYTVDADKDYSGEGRTTDKTVATNQFSDYATGDVTYLSRTDGFANYDEATASPSDFAIDVDTKSAIEANTNAGYDAKASNDKNDEMPELEADYGLTLADMTGLDYDDAKWDKLLSQMSAKDMVNLVNVGGWQTVEVESVGKMATSDCDGPAGLSNFITGNYGTAFPAEVLMAQTWNQELAEQIGEALGQEYANADNYGWYGPAMNTHRSAFAGRNFEYYSEDGVLAGKFASAEVNGAAKYGVYPYIKHFALNDQETNRCAILVTHSNEQAIREIYLKPFESVVKNFDFEKNVLAVMTGYNWIGTKPAYANSDLINTVLRDEWGFVGMVVTDYNGSYGYQNTDAAIKNGGDLMLGYGSADSNKLDTKQASVVIALRKASKNILYTVANSGYYLDSSEQTDGMSNMTKLFIKVDVIAAIAIILLESLLIFIFKKRTKVSI